MLPKQAVSFAQLRREGLSENEITRLSAGLRLFPTPFKGIYYVPLEEERRGWFIERPLKVLEQAIGLFLGTKEFYFGCGTAEEALGLNWRPSGSVHVVNSKLSRRIDLRKRAGNGGATWRAKKTAKLLSFYGSELVFHRSGSIGKAKTRETPYGRFATEKQIKVDRKRFGEISDS